MAPKTWYTLLVKTKPFERNQGACYVTTSSSLQAKSEHAHPCEHPTQTTCTLCLVQPTHCTPTCTEKVSCSVHQRHWGSTNMGEHCAAICPVSGHDLDEHKLVSCKALRKTFGSSQVKTSQPRCTRVPAWFRLFQSRCSHAERKCDHERPSDTFSLKRQASQLLLTGSLKLGGRHCGPLACRVAGNILTVIIVPNRLQ